jgi:hypothetical protein
LNRQGRQYLLPQMAQMNADDGVDEERELGFFTSPRRVFDSEDTGIGLAAKGQEARSGLNRQERQV